MANSRTLCFTCNQDKTTYPCDGCLKRFCLPHLQDHRQVLNGQLEKIVDDHDRLRHDLLEQQRNPRNSPLIKQIDQWERTSIEAVSQTAQECRDAVLGHTSTAVDDIDGKLARFTAQLRKIRQENEFTEIDLKRLTNKLIQMTQELTNPANLALQEDSEALINKVCITISTSKQRPEFEYHKWKPQPTTVAGGNGYGQQLNQLYCPYGIFVDQKKNVFIADWNNHRVVRWRWQAKFGTVVAGGNGPGKRRNQLAHPTHAIVDARTDSLLIADRDNRRVIRWCDRITTEQQIVIDNIDCWGLAMGNEGFLYVSNPVKHEVRRWKEGDKEGTLVAGGNKFGDQLNQLNSPTFLFVDEDQSVYVSDRDNHRVMKWREGAKEGVIIAGGNRGGNSLTQLYCPAGVLVDRYGQIYVADEGNDRIMRWREGEREGEIVVGGSGRGQGSSQLCDPHGLSFDDDGNLYVADQFNHRIQKFDVVSA